MKKISIFLLAALILVGCQNSDKNVESDKESVEESIKDTTMEEDKVDDMEDDHSNDDKDEDHDHNHVDFSSIKEEDIDTISKHGDHYHIKTKDGLEYVSHEDPSSHYPNIEIKEYEGEHGDHEHEHEEDDHDHENDEKEDKE